MSTYQRFEELPVWQAAVALYENSEAVMAKVRDATSRSFRDQLERAALSVSNNIAEGFERGTTNELLSFLYIARGSAGEVRSMLTLLSRRPAVSEFKAEISELTALAESCSRQLRAWAESLQNSDIAGTRHLNDTSRANYQKRIARQKGEANFQALLVKHLPPDHPLLQKQR